MSKLTVSGRSIIPVILCALVGLAFCFVPYVLVGNIKQARSEGTNISLLEKAVALSERRIKKNIQKITTLENGLNVFSFQSMFEPTVYIGFMADDLVKNEKFKDYVIEMGEGFYTIHYEKLGYQKITFKDWKSHGLSAFKISTDVANQTEKKP